VADDPSADFTLPGNRIERPAIALLHDRNRERKTPSADDHDFRVRILVFKGDFLGRRLDKARKALLVLRRVARTHKVAPTRPEEFRDEYREALLALIDEKVAGLPVEAPAEEPAPAAGRPGEVVDFMAALQASIDAAKKRAAGGA
jgi:hypothetical protein